MASNGQTDCRGIFFSGRKNDHRGRIYSKLCMAGPDYTRAVNALDDTNKECVLGLMIASKYNIKQPDMRDEDIHNEFVDFIVEAALWHRKIDTSTERTHKLHIVREIVEEYARLLSDSSAMRLKLGGQEAAASSKSANVDLYTYAPPNLNSFGEVAIGEQPLIGNLMAKKGTGVLSIFGSTLAGLIIAGKRSKNVTELNNQYTNVILNVSDEIVKALLENKGRVTDAVSGAVTTPNLFTLAFTKALYNRTPLDIINDVYPKNKDELLAHVKSDVNKMVYGYTMNMMGLYNPTTRAENDGTTEHALYEQYYNHFVAQVVQTVADSTIAFIKREVAGSYTTLSDQYAAGLQDYIRTNSNMSSDTQNFFEKNLSLLKRDNGNWKEVHIMTNTTADRSKYRLNLKKPDTGSNQTRFGNTIPLVKAGYNIHNLWYTDANKKVVRIKFHNDVRPDEQNFLQKLYNNVYANNTQTPGMFKITVGGAEYQLSLPLDWSPNLYSATLFNVHPEKLFLKLLNVHTKAFQDARQRVAENDLPLIDENWNVWRQENNKFYRAGDSKPTELSEQDLNPNNNCASTFLNGDVGQCTNYISQCLLGNDRGDLSACLEFLKSKDFFNAANNVFQNLHTKINPVVALKTLTRLEFNRVEDFDQRAGKRVIQIESADEWMDRLQKENKYADVSQVVTNEGLRRYLNQLVQFVNNNPGLLNKGYSGQPMVGQLPAPVGFVRDLGIERYRKPKSLGKAYTGPQYAIPPVSARLARVGNSYAPVYGMGMNMLPFTVPGMRVGYNMAGGNGRLLDSQMGLIYPRGAQSIKDNNVSSATELKRFYENVKTELKHKNKSLSQKSDADITNLLNKFEIYEKNVVNSLVQLERYVFLTDVFSDYNIKEITVSEVNRLVREHEELENRYKKFNGKLARVFDTLMNVVYVPDDPLAAKYNDSLRNHTIPDAGSSSRVVLGKLTESF